MCWLWLCLGDIVFFCGEGIVKDDEAAFSASARQSSQRVDVKDGVLRLFVLLAVAAAVLGRRSLLRSGPQRGRVQVGAGMRCFSHSSSFE